MENLAIALILAGFLLVFVGALAIVAGVLTGGVAGSGALVVFIGPVPIIVGWGVNWLPLIMVALAAIALMLLAAYIMVRGGRR